MGNISWRSQASSEDTDSSLHGDLDEDTGTDTNSPIVRMVDYEINAVVFLLMLTLVHCCKQGWSTGESTVSSDSKIV